MGGSSSGGKGGKGGGGATVREVRMGIVYGVCLEADAILGVKIADKTISWPAVTENSVVEVIQRDLFGGDTEAGGLSGRIYIMFGDSVQKLPAEIAARFDRTPDTMSGYRNMVTMIFAGQHGFRDARPFQSPLGAAPVDPLPFPLPVEDEFPEGDPLEGGLFGRVITNGVEYLIRNGVSDALLYAHVRPLVGDALNEIAGLNEGYETDAGDSTELGFHWGDNATYVPEIAFLTQRFPKGLSGDPFIGEDCNPAHMQYECIVNDDFGRGQSPDLIDEDSFLAAAQVLRDEDFGLSMPYKGQQKVSEFMEDIDRHADSITRFNGHTGKWEMTLLREKVPDSTTRVVNPDNAELLRFQRRVWGSTATRVTVGYTNRENNKEETIDAHDTLGFTIQRGDQPGDKQPFLGLRRSDLAATVAERELRKTATPLASAEVLVDRSFRSTRVGDVVTFDWSTVLVDGEPFADSMVMRVVEMDYGERGEPGVRMGLLEDIFSFGRTEVAVQDSLVSEVAQPTEVSTYVIESAPYYLLARSLGDSGAAALAYPDTYMAVLTGRISADQKNAEVYSLEVDPQTSEAGYESGGTLWPLTAFNLETPMVPENFTVIPYPPGTTLADWPNGGLVSIQDANGEQKELMLIKNATATTVRLGRGVLDTVPQNHAAGVTGMVVRRNASILEGQTRSDGETVTRKIVTSTSQGRLPLDFATPIDSTASDRAYLPTRGAFFRIESEPHNATVFEDALTVTAEWAHRNRLTETALILDWDDDSVTPEAGTQYQIEVELNGTLVHTTPLTPLETVDIAVDTLGIVDGDVLLFRLLTEIAGVSSLQNAEVTATVLPAA